MEVIWRRLNESSVTTQTGNSCVWGTGTKDRNIPPLMGEILLLPPMYLREMVTRPGRQAGRYIDFKKKSAITYNYL